MEIPEIGTLAWAALVASLVTLGIEWIAKPSLEVRKDRIVQRHRDVRQLQQELDAFTLVVGKLNAACNSDQLTPLVPQLAQAALGHVHQIEASFVPVARGLPVVVRTTFARTLGGMMAPLVMLGPPGHKEDKAVRQERQTRALDALTGAFEQFRVPMDYLLFMVPWRRPHRWWTRLQARRLMGHLPDSQSRGSTD